MRELRLAAGLKQEDLAKLMKIRPAVVSHWETGRQIPSLEKAQAIAKHLHVTLDQLAESLLKHRPQR